MQGSLENRCCGQLHFDMYIAGSKFVNQGVINYYYYLILLIYYFYRKLCGQAVAPVIYNRRLPAWELLYVHSTCQSGKLQADNVGTVRNRARLTAKLFDQMFIKYKSLVGSLA